MFPSHQEAFLRLLVAIGLLVGSLSWAQEAVRQLPAEPQRAKKESLVPDEVAPLERNKPTAAPSPAVTYSYPRLETRLSHAHRREEIRRLRFIICSLRSWCGNMCEPLLEDRDEL